MEERLFKRKIYAQLMAWGQENDIKMDDGRGMRADD